MTTGALPHGQRAGLPRLRQRAHRALGQPAALRGDLRQHARRGADLDPTACLANIFDSPSRTGADPSVPATAPEPRVVVALNIGRARATIGPDRPGARRASPSSRRTGASRTRSRQHSYNGMIRKVDGRPERRPERRRRPTTRTPRRTTRCSTPRTSASRSTSSTTTFGGSLSGQAHRLAGGAARLRPASARRAATSTASTS